MFNNFKVSGLLSIGYGTLGLTVDKDLLAAAPTTLYGVFAELSQQNSFKILKLTIFLFNNFRYSGSSISHMRGMRAGGPT